MSSRLLAIFLSTLLALALPLPAAAQASAAPDDLLPLHRFQLAVHKSLGDFYLHNGMEGDQRDARMIDRSLEGAATHLENIGPLPGESSQALHGRLAQHWQQYRAALDELVAAVKTQGYTELQPVADLAADNRQLLELCQALYAEIQQENGRSVATLAQQGREQSLLMQAIAVDYASRSASVGATFIGGGEVRPIEQMVSQFAERLAVLEQAPQNTEQTRRTLRGVGTKWRYIEKSLMNYNESSVPFLVNKYSDSIIEGLEQVSAQYSASRS